MTDFKAIQLLLLDVDGVLTDGSILIDSQGGEIEPVGLPVSPDASVSWYDLMIGAACLSRTVTMSGSAAQAERMRVRTGPPFRGQKQKRSTHAGRTGR